MCIFECGLKRLQTRSCYKNDVFQSLNILSRSLVFKLTILPLSSNTQSVLLLIFCGYLMYLCLFIKFHFTTKPQKTFCVDTVVFIIFLIMGYVFVKFPSQYIYTNFVINMYCIFSSLRYQFSFAASCISKGVFSFLHCDQ